MGKAWVGWGDLRDVIQLFLYRSATVIIEAAPLYSVPARVALKNSIVGQPTTSSFRACAPVPLTAAP